MPTVRAVQRTQQTAAIPGARLTAAETPTSTGAGAARARARTAQALGDLGETGFQLAGSQYVRLKKEAYDTANLSANLETDNGWDTFEQQHLWEPETGAMNAQGKESIGAADRVAEEFEKFSAERAKGLGTPEQKAYFAKSKAARLTNMQMQLLRHQSGEMQKYNADELKSTLSNAASNAARNSLDPRRVGEELQRGTDAIDAGRKMFGWGDEQVKAAKLEFMTEAHVGVISNLLANQQPKAARIYLEAAEEAGQIDGSRLDDVKKAIKQASTDQQGEQAASDIWSSMGPKGDNDPISLDRMEDAARKKFGDDTDGLKATIAALRFRKQGVDDGRRERENARNQKVWGEGVLAGKSYKEISSMPEFIESPDIQLKVRDYLQRQAEHQASLAATAANRANAEEGRRYTATLRRERELEMNGWSAYWQMSDPATLRQTSRGDIMARITDLGPAHVQRLLADQEQLAKGDATVRAATIDNDLFKEVANEAGFSYVYKNPSDVTSEQRATLGRLRATVEDGIAKAQQDPKTRRVLTYDEKKKVMQDVVGRTVMVDKAFRYDVPAIAAVVSPNDKARAYVPMAEIPTQNQKEAANYLRSINPAFARLSDAAIFAQSQRAIERAYAAKLLGLGAEEERRRLLETQ